MGPARQALPHLLSPLTSAAPSNAADAHTCAGQTAGTRQTPITSGPADGHFELSYIRVALSVGPINKDPLVVSVVFLPFVVGVGARRTVAGLTVERRTEARANDLDAGEDRRMLAWLGEWMRRGFRIMVISCGRRRGVRCGVRADAQPYMGGRTVHGSGDVMARSGVTNNG